MGKPFDAKYMINMFGVIFQALPTTILITAVAFAAGLIIGFLCAIIRIYRVPVLRNLVTFYVSAIRGTPLLVQIYLSYYGLPIIIEQLNLSYGLKIDISSIHAIYFVYVAYSLNTGAYLSETIRGAIEAVDKGQWEAAASIGMTGYQTLWRIIIPQAFLIALPNLGNTIISLIKDTSLAFSVSIVELMGQSRIVGARNYRFFEVYIDAAIIYWVFCIIIELVFNRFERLLKRKSGGLD